MTSPVPLPRTCPCGTGLAYAGCCRPLHDGVARAETAETLMRSRFTAYAVGRFDYVFRTWHPRTRPAEIGPIPGLSWTSLEVVDLLDGTPTDDEGVVEFRAHYDEPTGPGVLHERSRFVRRRERWVYLEAESS